MNCKDCIHNGECNGQPYCGGAWYVNDSTYRQADEKQEADDGE